MKKIVWLGILLLFVLGLLVRLYRFDNPIADWHSWRQSDTAAVSKLLLANDFDLFHPRYFDISNVQSGFDNPHGYRMVEFPIYNLFQAGAYSLFGVFTLEEWGRIVSIVSSLLSGLFLFLLIRKHLGEKEGILSLFFFLFLPFSIFYSRVLLPDTMTVMTILGGLYFFDRFLDEERKRVKPFYFFLAGLFIAVSFLLRPYALFFLLPHLYLAWKKFGFSFLKKWYLWILAIISLVPFVLWRYWISQFPEGIPVSVWLLNGGDIRFKGAFFYWILGERVSKLILGYLGISLVIAGLFKKAKDKDIFFAYAFLISSIIYISVIARGNVQHDYYQILIIPALCIFLARGITFFYSFTGNLNRYIAVLCSVGIVIFMFTFSWFYVRDYFNINNWAMVEAGRKANEILPKDAKVIAPYDGDTTFLYQIGRPGWPVFQQSIEELIKKGATHLVIQNPTENDFLGFGDQYETLASSSSYLILKLQ